MPVYSMVDKKEMKRPCRLLIAYMSIFSFLALAIWGISTLPDYKTIQQRYYKYKVRTEPGRYATCFMCGRCDERKQMEEVKVGAWCCRTRSCHGKYLKELKINAT